VKYVKDPETQEAKRVMFDRQSGKQVNRKFKIQERKTRGNIVSQMLDKDV